MSQIPFAERPKLIKGLMINVKCRDCIFYKNSALYTDGKFPQSCSNLGVGPSANPCPNFAPKVEGIKNKFDEKIDVSELGEFLKKIDSRKFPWLASILTMEGKTRKFGFSFGETVYIKMFNGNYLSNYRKASVVYATKTHVHVLGKDGWRGMIMHESVILPRQYAKIRDGLKAKRLLVDPATKQYFDKTQSIEISKKDSIARSKGFKVSPVPPKPKKKTKLKIMSTTIR